MEPNNTEDLDYTEAYAQLQELLSQLEDGAIKVDALTEKVQQANVLLAICEAKLREIEGGITMDEA
jgi:exodeoxyribonuclease VII small subunit